MVLLCGGWFGLLHGLVTAVVVAVGRWLCGLMRWVVPRWFVVFEGCLLGITWLVVWQLYYSEYVVFWVKGLCLMVGFVVIDCVLCAFGLFDVIAFCVVGWRFGRFAGC